MRLAESSVMSRARSVEKMICDGGDPRDGVTEGQAGVGLLAVVRDSCPLTKALAKSG